MTIKNSLHLLLALWLKFLFFGSIIPPPTPATRRNGKSIRNTNNEKPGIIRFHNDKQWTMAMVQAAKKSNPSFHFSLSLTLMPSSCDFYCLMTNLCVLSPSLSTFFYRRFIWFTDDSPREARRVNAGLRCLSSACERLWSCLRWAERMNEKKKESWEQLECLSRSKQRLNALADASRRSIIVWAAPCCCCDAFWRCFLKIIAKSCWESAEGLMEKWCNFSSGTEMKLWILIHSASLFCELNFQFAVASMENLYSQNKLKNIVNWENWKKSANNIIDESVKFSKRKLIFFSCHRSFFRLKCDKSWGDFRVLIEARKQFYWTTSQHSTEPKKIWLTSVNNALFSIN